MDLVNHLSDRLLFAVPKSKSKLLISLSCDSALNRFNTLCRSSCIDEQTNLLDWMQSSLSALKYEARTFTQIRST